MLTRFRRPAPRTSRYTWVPAVDAQNPWVIATLLTFSNR